MKKISEHLSVFILIVVLSAGAILGCAPPAPTKYYVEFVTNDGSEVETVYVSVIEESPVTTKPGFDFEGWFEDPEFTTQAEFPYYPTKNTVLYAKWQQSTTVFTLNEDNEISGVSGVPADGIITIPAYVNGVKVAGIAYKAFEYNEQIKQVTVAEEITSFGPKCFRNCVNLTSVKISDKTTVISDFMFDGCKSLKQFDFPDSLVQIRSNGFSNTGLETVVLPQSVKDLWDYVFDGCANLQSVDLGQVTSLGAGIFKNCVKLESIAIPDSVKKLEGNKMFYGCENLSDIKFPSNPIPVQNTFLDDTAYYLNPDNWGNGVLYLNKHLIYLNGNFSNVTDYQIKEGTVCIAEKTNNRILKIK